MRPLASELRPEEWVCWDVLRLRLLAGLNNYKCHVEENLKHERISEHGSIICVVLTATVQVRGCAWFPGALMSPPHALDFPTVVEWRTMTPEHSRLHPLGQVIRSSQGQGIGCRS